MDNKLIGGILLIIGTSIGGAMLALPIATAQAGFVYSTIFLFICWLVMTLGAFLILEVNLWFPRDSNLISMARATIGPIGTLITWITYFLLLYSLLAAYVAGGGDLLHGLLQNIQINLPSWLCALSFTFLLGLIVYRGIRSVDYANRGLMFSKLGAYIILVIIILPFISSKNLSFGEIKYIPTSITVMITSFGFATIVPSLRAYFKDDINKLRRAILIGSLIPLVCYIFWNLAIMGVLPTTGEYSLVNILHSDHSTSKLVQALTTLLEYKTIVFFANLFTSICMVTSFLGVALGLSDFIADGFNIPRNISGRIITHLLTLTPPLLVALFFPNAFIGALSYAGIYCVMLLILIPALMAWSGRYKKNLAQSYQVGGGKLTLVLLMVVALLIMIEGLSSF
jgi:tyrosine-specific transport protein